MRSTRIADLSGRAQSTIAHVCWPGALSAVFCAKALRGAHTHAAYPISVRTGFSMQGRRRGAIACAVRRSRYARDDDGLFGHTDGQP
jgi:hypothetical protein